jgi:16S rRNA (cytosine1402-N4)-methyltransferase
MRFETTQDLAEVIVSVVPKTRSKSIHPATRVFQALRIEVNNELSVLDSFIQISLKHLKHSGKLVVISFHSGEDRIVKQAMKTWEKSGQGECETKKPVIPHEEEIRTNPRSRSAKMRVFIKQ